MAIGRIGQRSTGAPVGAIGASTGPRPSGRFRAHLSEAALAAAAKSATPLAQVRAGAMSVDQYIDLKVSAATSHLAGLPRSQLATIERALRNALAHDAALTEPPPV